MGLRILTGVLVPHQPSGSAAVLFHPHQVTGAAGGIHLEELGDRDDFKRPPSGFVSLRHFTVQDRNRVFDNSLRIQKEEYHLEHAPLTTEQMVISWRTTNGAKIKEIAYLIVGDA